MEDIYYYIECGIYMVFTFYFAYIFDKYFPDIPAIFRLIFAPLLIVYTLVSLTYWFFPQLRRDTD